MSSNQFSALATHYDELMQTVPYLQWAEYVQLLFGVVEHVPEHILDCACGTGNVTFELAQLGYTMTGIDLSGPMIEIAKRKAANLQPPIEFLQGDLTNFDLGRSFDSATCLYDSLNYILEPQDLWQAFLHIGRHLPSGGIFVFDMNSVYALSADLFSQSQIDPSKPLQYDWHATYDRHAKICSVEMEFSRRNEKGDVEIFHEVHRERAYSLEEVKTMLGETGWRCLKTYDAYTLNRTHNRSERWFFIAQRE